jgi:hypothetical protein
MYTESGLSTTRQAKTVAFLTALKARCLAVPENERDKPLPGGLSEIGYTYTTEIRLRNHREHRSSNYIMNLFDSALALKWPQRFSVHQFIMFLCADATQGSIAEILFTRLALAYTGNGGGFTHYPPGRSNQSAGGFDTEQWQRWWRRTMEICRSAENEEEQLRQFEATEQANTSKLQRLQAIQDEIAQYEAQEAFGTAPGMDVARVREDIVRYGDELEEKETERANLSETMKALIQGLSTYVDGVADAKSAKERPSR